MPPRVLLPVGNGTTGPAVSTPRLRSYRAAAFGNLRAIAAHSRLPTPYFLATRRTTEIREGCGRNARIAVGISARPIAMAVSTTGIRAYLRLRIRRIFAIYRRAAAEPLTSLARFPPRFAAAPRRRFRGAAAAFPRRFLRRTGATRIPPSPARTTYWLLGVCWPKPAPGAVTMPGLRACVLIAYRLK